MASAVIRAMSFGALSSSDDHRGRGDSDHSSGGGSRSSSKNRNSLSKTLSREPALELDNSLGLERSLSRLSFVSSGQTPGGGILINRSRPSSPQPPSNRNGEPLSISTSVGSTHSSITTDQHARPSGPIRTHSSTSTSTSSNEPLTPSSTPGFTPLQPHLTPPPPPPFEHNSHSTTELETRQNAASSGLEQPPRVEKKPKIKFAPLPQIRPRSYSTGRNVWAEHGPEGGGGEQGVAGQDYEGEFEGGPLGARHLVRREDGGVGSYEYDKDGTFIGDEDDYDESDDEGAGVGGGRFNPRRQSWTDTLGMGSVWGLNGNNKGRNREVDEDAISLGSSTGGNGSDFGLSSSGGKEKESGAVSKIFKPFLFGRKKSSSSTKSAKSTSSSTVDEAGGGGGGGGSLSRQTSTDSQVSFSNDTPGPPTPTNQGTRPKGMTGIPMRKASTWDSTNSGGSKGSGSTTKPRAQKRFSANPASSLPPRDPSTPQIIYYASPSRSARPARRAQYPPVAQRSRTAPKPIRKSEVEEPEFSEWGSVGSVGSVGSPRGKGASADEDEDGSGMAWIRRRRREREEREAKERELAMSQSASSDSTEVKEEEQEPPAHEEKENEVVQRAIGRNPKRQSTVDSTFSMTSSTSTIRPASPKIMSGLSLSRPPVETEGGTAVDEPESAENLDASESESISDEEEEEEELANNASDDESEEDEEDELETGEKEEEDDLTAEELAQEEALADAARRTAKGAGAERYHSTTHENVLHVPSDTVKRQPPQPLRRNTSEASSFA